MRNKHLNVSIVFSIILIYIIRIWRYPKAFLVIELKFTTQINVVNIHMNLRGFNPVPYLVRSYTVSVSRREEVETVVQLFCRLYFKRKY